MFKAKACPGYFLLGADFMLKMFQPLGKTDKRGRGAKHLIIITKERLVLVSPPYNSFFSSGIETYVCTIMPLSWTHLWIRLAGHASNYKLHQSF